MNTSNLKTYDILLYKGKGFTSWLIEVGTKSDYSHVAVVVDPGIYLGIESNTGSQSGVRAMDLRKADQKEVDIFRVKPKFRFDGKKVISFLVDHLGAKYDYLGVAGLGALKVLHVLSFGAIKVHNDFQREKDYFCSELIYQAFNEGGLDIVPQVSEADVTSPGDIAQSERLQKI